jgi:hypothetical protein
MSNTACATLFLKGIDIGEHETQFGLANEIEK